ncbi:MAG: ABC transporter ATP-binding protein [Clostridia bacterium]|nr:ABC transporter ATP-binding protein [Clostridia bacterium]
MCDLALPEHMSNIVSVGIQQQGIESLIPDAVTADSFNVMLTLTTGEEKALVTSSYTEKDGAYYLNENVSVQFESFMTKLVAVYGAVSTVDSSQQSGVQSELAGQLDPNGSFVEQIHEIISSQMGDTVANQLGISFLAKEYEALDISKGTPYILKTGLKMLGFALIIALCTVMVSLLASRIAASCGREMRKDVFGKVIRFSNKEFNEFSSASLITRCTNDIQQVQILVIMTLRMVFYAPIIGIGALLKVLDTGRSLSWIIAVAILAIFSLIIVLMVIAMPKFKALQKLVDKVNLVSREILNGLPVIRAFSREKYEEERFDKANKDLTRTNLFVNRVMAFMMPMMMLIMNATSILIVWVGASAVESSQLQVGDIMAFIQYTMQIIISFLMLSMMSILLPRAIISAGRISEVLNTDISIENAEKTVAFPEDVQGTVEFKNVYFKYPNAEEYVLKNISFKTNKGETTAIIGSTGCGKSTLINLIPRFYDVTEGEVLVNGVDVRNVDLNELRDRLGYVPQKANLFTGTIASNIGYGLDEYTQEDLEFAAKIAQAEKLIAEKPGNYNAEISQGGTNVSGGQRQRLSIARAIAKNPEIYIFDDSFSALDFKTDSALRKALNEIEGKTKIIVAQRISTVLNADRIIVLEDGEVVGMGTHKELIKDCPAYVQIAQSQLSKGEMDL